MAFWQTCLADMQAWLDAWQIWQIWLAAGILLMIAELALPSFFLFFFGIAAILTSFVTFIVSKCTFLVRTPPIPEDLDFPLLEQPPPVPPELPFFAQAILFCALSFIGIFFFRKMFSNAFTGNKIGRDNVLENDFDGKDAKVVERITPQTSGKVEFNGVNWRACSDTVIEPGETVKVTARENLTLFVATK